jgi:hypothetical protein
VVVKKRIEGQGRKILSLFQNSFNLAWQRAVKLVPVAKPDFLWR